MKLPVWASMLTILGVGILCFLGMWQLKRLAWKHDLIGRLEGAYQSEDESQWLAFDADFTYGRTAGDLLTDKAILIGPRVRDGKVGQDLVAPLRLDDGRILFVNMGWTAVKNLSDLPIHHALNDRVYFTGLLRIPSWNSFTPENKPEHDLWYRLDLAEIAAAKGLEAPLPYMLSAEKSSYAFKGAFPNTRRYYPKNNHQQYALFWFAMAGVLIVIYALRFLRG